MNDPVGSRQANLSRLLRLAHLEGPLSRATLTTATGLNRSTIGDLVGDLVSLGIAEERAPDPSRRVGRPSPLVAAHRRVVAVAVNPEVDALTLGVVGLDRTVRFTERIEQSGLMDPEHTAEVIGERIAAWREGDLADAAIAGIGIAVPGLVRASDGLVRDAPHLRWTDVALRELVESRTGLHTAVGNDAAMAIVAEHLFGAAAGVDNVVYLNGGASGVLEDEVSRSRLLAVLQRSNVDEPTLARLLGETRATEVLEEVARQRRILATALANAVNVLNPSIVVLGGFLGMLAEHDLPGFTAAVLAQSMAANGEDLEIRTAALAADRLIIGAAEAAFQDLLRDPAGTALR